MSKNEGLGGRGVEGVTSSKLELGRTHLTQIFVLWLQTSFRLLRYHKSNRTDFIGYFMYATIKVLNIQIELRVVLITLQQAIGIR